MKLPFDVERDRPAPSLWLPEAKAAEAERRRGVSESFRKQLIPPRGEGVAYGHLGWLEPWDVYIFYVPEWDVYKVGIMIHESGGHGSRRSGERLALQLRTTGGTEIGVWSFANRPAATVVECQILLEVVDSWVLPTLPGRIHGATEYWTASGGVPDVVRIAREMSDGLASWDVSVPRSACERPTLPPRDDTGSVTLFE